MRSIPCITVRGRHFLRRLDLPLGKLLRGQFKESFPPARTLRRLSEVRNSSTTPRLSIYADYKFNIFAAGCQCVFLTIFPMIFPTARAFPQDVGVDCGNQDNCHNDYKIRAGAPHEAEGQHGQTSQGPHVPRPAGGSCSSCPRRPGSRASLIPWCNSVCIWACSCQ